MVFRESSRLSSNYVYEWAIRKSTTTQKQNKNEKFLNTSRVEQIQSKPATRKSDNGKIHILMEMKPKNQSIESINQSSIETHRRCYATRPPNPAECAIGSSSSLDATVMRLKIDDISRGNHLLRPCCSGSRAGGGPEKRGWPAGVVTRTYSPKKL